MDLVPVAVIKTCPGGFIILQETRANTKSKNHRKSSKHNGCIVSLRVSTGGVNLFFILTICTNFPSLLFMKGKILIPSPQLILCVYFANWYTVVDANLVSDTPGRVCLLCWTFLGRIWIQNHCADPTVTILMGVLHHHDLLIPPLLSLIPHLPPISYDVLVDSCFLFCPTSCSSACHTLLNSGNNSRAIINMKVDVFPYICTLYAAISLIQHIVPPSPPPVVPP